MIGINGWNCTCRQDDDLKSCDMEGIVFPVYGTRLGEIPEVSDAYDAILKMEKIDVSHFDLSDIFHKSEDVTNHSFLYCNS